MTEKNQNSPLVSGIAVIHSNQLEELRDVVEYWLRQHPLAPLENEIFLVQSNGMGQWLKQSLAATNSLGIAAAINMQLPSYFIWNVYRAVLGSQIPKEQLLAKSPLTWRLYRLLPLLSSKPEFQTLARFLADDNNCRKRYQLSEQLADLFDQYQVYRSDWISDWAKGIDNLRNAQGNSLPMPEPQRWQAALWRAIQADLGDDFTPYASRATVHSSFMNRISELDQRPVNIPRRILLFGLSSLPQQSLEVLAKLGKFCQLVLFVHNPCRHYWADIIEDKELIKTARRRQKLKPGMSTVLSPEELHAQGQPLLAAWGKQGRDYIRLLDQFDETQNYIHWNWPDSKIDLFKDFGLAGRRTLLQQLQQTLLDLEPTPTTPIILPAIDHSVAFHVAHSPQREVEILHDQLLERFNSAHRNGNCLQPREVIVMVPDISKYAPHIRAVFGQFKPDDYRYIPYSLTDQQQRGQNPLLVAVEVLTNLPESRFNVSDLLGLLETPALRKRFDIDELAFPKLHDWIEEAGIRWGLSSKQRAQAIEGLPDNLETNTWQFGLKRMLLGYAVGAGEPFNGIEPYKEIGGLDAKWLGGLSNLLETLEQYNLQLQKDKNVSEWQQILLSMLDDFFVITDEIEGKTLETLTRSLTAWANHCDQAALTSADALPLNVVREAWLAGVDEPTLHQRFLSGNVNFCTLMPMRAIPFRIICLMGMNDGDYPRIHQALSFDLMSQRGQYRPGDRSRRQDDQYLFLEALMSAREQLYISWIGRNIRDNSVLPPSVLISQLRDNLELGWKLADNKTSLLSALTVDHPLQPFSKHYISGTRDPRLFTYAREWFEEANPVSHPPTFPKESEEENQTLSIESLANFLKCPVKAFCNHTLKFGYDREMATSEDNEPFAFGMLENYALSNDMLTALQEAAPLNLAEFYDHQQEAMAAQGKLPLGPFAKAAYENIKQPVDQAWQQYQAVLSSWPEVKQSTSLELEFKVANSLTIRLTGNLSPIRHSQDGSSNCIVYLVAQTLTKNENIIHHKLILQWVLHLAACTQESNLQTIVVSPDCVIEFPPLSKKTAYSLLSSLVNAWYEGLQSPLPIACRTAFTWLGANPEKAELTAKTQYEGNDWNYGEVNYDAYLARLFPDFDSLNDTEDNKGFAFWLDVLYRPIFDHIKLK